MFRYIGDKRVRQPQRSNRYTTDTLHHSGQADLAGQRQVQRTYGGRAQVLPTQTSAQTQGS